jgi:hypothetical protein
LPNQPKAPSKIRFRRSEIADLASLPSAEGQGAHWRRGHRRIRTKKIAGLVGLCAGVLLVLLVVLSTLVLQFGVGTGAVRSRAERVIQQAAGPGIVASIGDASFNFGLRRPLSISFDGLELASADRTGTPFRAQSVSFDVALLPLMRGEVRLGAVGMESTRIDLSALPEREGTSWLDGLVDERGLVDADRVLRAVFDPLNAAFDLVARDTANHILLEDIEIVFPPAVGVKTAIVQRAELGQGQDGRLTISAVLDVDGRAVGLEGSARRDAATRRISDLDVQLVSDPAADAAESSALRAGAIRLGIDGGQGDDNLDRLTLDGGVDDLVLDFGARGQMTGNVGLRATLVEGSRKLEVDRLLVTTGRSTFDFNGAVGPQPAAAEGEDTPRYRYELVSGRSALAPEASPEQSLVFGARVDGTFDPATGVLEIGQATLSGGEGEARADGRIEFARGQAPGIVLAISASGLPVAHAKQIWPWFAADRPRRWVFDHVFGGRIADGSITFRVDKGRLGNGVPLSSEEIVGVFGLERTRFDTTGLLPPVRDANGTVTFRGHSVSVALASGTVYLPSGRTVSASDGLMTIDRTVRDGRVGNLEIGVAGDADAIAELASFEPINGLRRIGLEPQDLSGTVKGRVMAEVPLHREVDRRALRWKVDLDYENLSVAKAIGGQTLTEAKGNISVVPEAAELRAAGKLNGIPAQLDLVEPLKEGGPERHRKVALTLDADGRKRLAPGLNDYIGGTVTLDLEETAPGVRHIIADLTRATLEVPWAGWSKGQGVAAAAQFTMNVADGRTRLTDFSITGESFSVDGSLTIAGGGLETADFGTLRLNRSDDVTMKLRRSGRGYAVEVEGKSLDARGLVKRLLAERGKGGGGSGKSVPVSVKLAVDNVTGFNSVALSNVRMAVSTAGSRLGEMSFEARTSGGADVSASNSGEGNRKTLRMRSADAGSVLRFLDLYANMQGGSLQLALADNGEGTLTGQVDTRNFTIVNEPRLASIVGTRAGSETRSLREAVNADIDTATVRFDRGYAQVQRGPGFLRIANGVLRGTTIGTTFQGTLYDQNGRMDMTGTFMPAYGLNRLFGDIPVLGALLGNGRDGALIGVTYKLDGDAKAPRVTVNPLSVIAPGIFRTIFEFD